MQGNLWGIRYTTIGEGLSVSSTSLSSSCCFLLIVLAIVGFLYQRQKAGTQATV